MRFSLFPAHAGVIPASLSGHTLVLAFPRARGGDPLQYRQQEGVGDFSPRTRG